MKPKFKIGDKVYVRVYTSGGVIEGPRIVRTINDNGSIEIKANGYDDFVVHSNEFRLIDKNKLSKEQIAVNKYKEELKEKIIKMCVAEYDGQVAISDEVRKILELLEEGD